MGSFFFLLLLSLSLFFPFLRGAANVFPPPPSLHRTFSCFNPPLPLPLRASSLTPSTSLHCSLSLSLPLSPSLTSALFFLSPNPKQELTRLPLARPLAPIAFLVKLLMTVLALMLTRHRAPTVQLVTKQMDLASQRAMHVRLDRSLPLAQRRARLVDLDRHPMTLKSVVLIAQLVFMKTITNALDVLKGIASQRVDKHRAAFVVQAQKERMLTDTALCQLHASCATRASIKISRDRTAAKIAIQGTSLRPLDRKLRVVIAHRVSTLAARQPRARIASRASHQQPSTKHLLAEAATLDGTKSSSHKLRAKFVELMVATTRRKNIMIRLESQAARLAPPQARLQMLVRTAATTALPSFFHLVTTLMLTSTATRARAHGATDVLRDRKKSRAVQQLATRAQSVSSRRLRKSVLTHRHLTVLDGIRLARPARPALQASIVRVACV